MKYIAHISRIIFGLVFIFSGFVKAIDPWGSAYKFTDYFEAFNLSFLEPLSLFFSIVMSALEFCIGMAMVFNVWMPISALFGLLFMSFFTPLTLYLAIANPVSDCGCFGDAIIMTNWQTFYKNIFLIALAIIVFYYRKKFIPFFSRTKEILLFIVFFFISVGISAYCLRHLPLIDFLEWKVGNSMKIDKSVKDKYYLTYRNKQTGETKEYLSPNFPWNDSTWLANWEFVSQRVEAAPRPNNLIHIVDENNHDYSFDITQNPDFQFILIMYYVEKASLKNLDKIKELYEAASQNNISFVALTGSTPEAVKLFKEKHNLEFEFYYADETVLKTVIRSNPGLMLIKDGKILAKWSHYDTPKFEDINFDKLLKKYFSSK